MKRYLLGGAPLALLLLLGASTPAVSQEARSLSIEVHLLGLGRGYLHPLDATVARLAKLKGLKAVRPLGHTPGMTRLLITTDLDKEALASLLQMQRLGKAGESGKGLPVLSLAPDASGGFPRAEARSIIHTIALAIRRGHAGTTGDAKPLFAKSDNLAKKLKKLGLKPADLTGEFYRPRDFHIEEDAAAGGWARHLSYRIWAGAKYEGLVVGDVWNYTPPSGDLKPDPESRFVGAELTIGRWTGGFNWTDYEGFGLNDRGHERSEMAMDGKELAVQAGARKLESLLRALAVYRVRNPEKAFQALPRETGWALRSQLQLEDDYSDPNIYREQTLWHTWIEDESSQEVKVRVRAYDDRHPLYLDALIEIDLLIREGSATIEKIAEDEEKEPEKNPGKKPGNKKRKVTLPKEALQWTIGAEESAEVFRQRRLEARAAMAQIFKALQGAVKQHPLGDLCGALTDELRGKLGVELGQAGHFRPDAYSIRPQMLGDVEISVGSVLTGGRWWLLVNPKSGKVLRSHQ